jgi:hypothetical protein
MKRKFKLITSVASLCLAIALMAFGVYAAAKPTVTVTGSVTFTATHVYADIYADVADAAVASGCALAFDYTGVAASELRNEETSSKDYGTLTMPAINDMNVRSAYQVKIKDASTSESVGVGLESVKLTTGEVPAGASVKLYINADGLNTGDGVEYTSGTAINAQPIKANGNSLIYITVVVEVDPVAAADTFTLAPALEIVLNRADIA